VYPNLGMGISFTNVSDLDRERLRELLGSISQPSVILGTRSITDLPARTGRGPLSSVANPSAVLQAIERFFDERRILSQEEFFRILRKFQNSET
jgi:predicted glycosyltransferase